jgi:hypothetical protein
MLELFRQQIDEALAFLGVKSVDELDPTYLELPPSWAAAGTVRRSGSETLEESHAPESERRGE